MSELRVKPVQAKNRKKLLPRPNVRTGRLSDQEREWRKVSERKMQTEREGTLRNLGWQVRHHGNSLRLVGGYNLEGKTRDDLKLIGDKSARGVPDTLAIHRRGWILFVEWKKELGQVDEDQAAVLDALAVGPLSNDAWPVRVAVLRPSDQELFDRLCVNARSVKQSELSLR